MSQPTNMPPAGLRRNHHFVPKAYLSGFTEPGSKHDIYVYRKGKSFKPGFLPSKNNPYRASISLAGMRRDFYAYENRDGSTEYEEIERLLEAEEKPVDTVLRKLRNEQIPDDADRQRLVRYILIMMKRVEYSHQRSLRLWPQIVDDFAKSNALKDAFESAEQTLPKDSPSWITIEANRNKYEDMLQAYKVEMPKSLILTSMFGPSGLLDVISAMTWRFLHARQDQLFVTSDNPVFFFDQYGLNKPHSELIFPISSRVALYATWRRDVSERFVDVGNSVVNLVNARTASRATTFLFGPQKSPVLSEWLNRDTHPLQSLPF